MFNFVSNSREYQDLFVLSVLGKKKKGTYLEIGAGSYLYGNNSYLLEKSFNWSGVSIDIKKEEEDNFRRHRSNPYICCDATAIDYTALIREHRLGAHIDFLQLDIDPPSNTFKAFQKIPFQDLKFSVVTYEHDVYRGAKKERAESREVLKSLGYVRVMSDVMHDHVAFEDWYINEEYMPNETWKEFIDSEIPMNPGKLPQKYVDIFKRL
jgi:hypothetical protein